MFLINSRMYFSLIKSFYECINSCNSLIIFLNKCYLGDLGEVKELVSTCQQSYVINI